MIIESKGDTGLGLCSSGPWSSRQVMGSIAALSGCHCAFPLEIERKVWRKPQGFW